MSNADNPLAQFLDVPGAKTTLPVSAAKAGFSFEFVNEARKYFNNFHYQMGGDHALYYNLRLSEFLPTAVAAPASSVKPLEVAHQSKIGQVRFTPKEGEMSLDEYVVHPNHRVQGGLIARVGGDGDRPAIELVTIDQTDQGVSFLMVELSKCAFSPPTVTKI